MYTKKMLALFTGCLLHGLFLSAAFASDGITLHMKVFLKGALIGTDPGNPMMRDDLRAKGFLPLTEPYSGYAAYEHKGLDGGGETLQDPSLLSETGVNALVDWVFIELRDPGNPSHVLATRAAWVQRDGDVVDTDGTSPVFFKNAPTGLYHVAVRHRNHLGVMTAEALELDENGELVDFTDPEYPVYGTGARISFGNRMALQAGDLNQDRKCVYQGPYNDIFSLFSRVLSANSNVNAATNHIENGYHVTDFNLDGSVIFNGPNSDRSHFFIHITGSCLLTTNCVLSEQIP